MPSRLMLGTLMNEVWELGTPTMPEGVLREFRDDVLRMTRLHIQWEDRCAMTYHLTDEAVLDWGPTAKEEAVLAMNIRHNAECPNRIQLCKSKHAAIMPCLMCDVANAKDRIVAMTGVADRALIVPAWVTEWERRWREGQEQEAAVSYQPAVRRYCALEG